MGCLPTPWESPVRFEYHKRRGTKLLIFENSSYCPQSFLEDNLGDDYYIVRLLVKPQDMCFSHVNRSRVYYVARHKHQTCLLADIQSTYLKAAETVRASFTGKRLPEPGDCLVATAADIRRTESARAHYLNIAPRFNEDWRYLLTPKERKRLKRYNKLWREKFDSQPHHNSNAFFNLGDNPLKRKIWSAEGSLPAFRRQAGKMWSAKANRWLTSTERLVALGYPANLQTSNAARCQPVPIPTAGADAMAGNAWHLSNAGLVLLVALSCVGNLH